MVVSGLRFQFVEHMPPVLEDGVLYVSVALATAIHRCCCGCGREVVTPLAPSGWTLVFDGESVSLHPSIGNWSFPCQSHYWIRRNGVQWAPRWPRARIEANRVRERRLPGGVHSDADGPPRMDGGVGVPGAGGFAKLLRKLKTILRLP